MSKRTIEFLREQTKRLEALGLVAKGSEEQITDLKSEEHVYKLNLQPSGPIHPHPGPGRKRRYESNAKKAAGVQG